MTSHMKNECGKPAKFKCSLCSYGSKRKFNLKLHMIRMHEEKIKINMAGYHA
ncbi:hypothetical protein Phum_PHUM397880 [Pediculus humanus corporis]|uniref:C2H2-type domain-containing protein n=1 Tax=Pediculus humanus subsp. corporis TaxID=121224 RepID=E0VRH7_PEDHC|nr:uncharacterized protein Phum_PHUM397880 [Pediculus humanus corporis]EEB15983.1 hypothetical protein Phum_PHUM397880 [Pediculus humanus corporis]